MIFQPSRLAFGFLAAIITCGALVHGNHLSGFRSCKIVYTKLGCYKDQRRPLPRLLLNFRSKIDWNHWDQFLQRLACQCANATVNQGYSYFGLQYMGECWSGLNPNVTYDDDGPSIKCRGRGLRPCGLDSMPCVGLARVNYVYKIGEQPIPSPEIEGSICEDVDPQKCKEHAEFCVPRYPAVVKNCKKTCNLC